MAERRDIKIYQGDTYIHEIRLKTENGTPIDISGRTYEGHVKRLKSSAFPVLTFNSSISDASNGIVQFSISASSSSNLKPGTYYYDFQETNGSIITTLLTGRAIVTGEVTIG